MISSLKKLALDQKVSKILHPQTNEQTLRSDQRLVKPKNPPLTTKYANHKCQIKKNLFEQQKQNIPEGLLTLEFQTKEDQKQRTIKFVTEKSVNDKKENCQSFLNLIDDQDDNQTTKMIQQQKSEITELRKIIETYQTKQKEQKFQWQSEKSQLKKKLENLKRQNIKMRNEITKMTQKIEENSKCQNFQDFKHFVGQKENEQVNEETQEDTVISRMIEKVQRLSKELQYFIDLSEKFKTQAKNAHQLLQQKIYELQTVNKEKKQLKEAFESAEERLKIIIEEAQSQRNILNGQITAYRDEYQVLKKRYFIMQSEFQKISLSTQDRKTIKENYEVLTKKYNCLYQSYKALYEEYVNRSRETDFIMELGDSGQQQIRLIGQRANLEASHLIQMKSVHYDGRKAMIHLPKESLCEYSQIYDQFQGAVPFENVLSQGPVLPSCPKIILKDLIKETLMQCKESKGILR